MCLRHRWWLGGRPKQGGFLLLSLLSASDSTKVALLLNFSCVGEQCKVLLKRREKLVLKINLKTAALIYLNEIPLPPSSCPPWLQSSSSFKVQPSCQPHSSLPQIGIPQCSLYFLIDQSNGQEVFQLSVYALVSPASLPVLGDSELCLLHLYLIN